MDFVLLILLRHDNLPVLRHVLVVQPVVTWKMPERHETKEPKMFGFEWKLTQLFSGGVADVCSVPEAWVDHSVINVQVIGYDDHLEISGIEFKKKKYFTLKQCSPVYLPDAIFVRTDDDTVFVLFHVLSDPVRHQRLNLWKIWVFNYNDAFRAGRSCLLLKPVTFYYNFLLNATCNFQAQGIRQAHILYSCTSYT